MISMILAIVTATTLPNGYDDPRPMLRQLGKYDGKSPAITIQWNFGFWGAADGLSIYRETSRVAGLVTLATTHCERWKRDDAYLRVLAELFEREKIKTIIQTNSLSPFGLLKAHQIGDPNYCHDGEIVFAHEPPNSVSRARLMYCAGRPASRMVVARHEANGRSLREAGLRRERIAAIYNSCETAYVAVGRTWYLDPITFSNCSACGSLEAHDRKLDELHRDALNALRHGLDFAACPMIGWQTGWRQDNLGRWQSSPWYAEPFPFFWTASFSEYGNSQAAVERLRETLAFNHTKRALVTPWVSLTFDGETRREIDGVDPAVNYGKGFAAGTAREPLVGVWPINPPTKMTAKRWSGQWKAFKALVEGLRDGRKQSPGKPAPPPDTKSCASSVAVGGSVVAIVLGGVIVGRRWLSLRGLRYA